MTSARVDDPDVGRQLAGEAADGRLVADEDDRVARVAPGEVEGAGHDLGRAVVAAHRVDGDADARRGRLGRGWPRLGHRVSGRRRRWPPAGLGWTARRPW